jgi:hypothetical protein
MLGTAALFAAMLGPDFPPRPATQKKCRSAEHVGQIYKIRSRDVSIKPVRSVPNATTRLALSCAARRDCFISCGKSKVATDEDTLPPSRPLMNSPPLRKAGDRMIVLDLADCDAACFTCAHELAGEYKNNAFIGQRRRSPDLACSFGVRGTLRCFHDIIKRYIPHRPIRGKLPENTDICKVLPRLTSASGS